MRAGKGKEDHVDLPFLPIESLSVPPPVHAPSSDSIAPVRAGQRVSISGTVERLPRAEEMYSWGLTNHDAEELTRRYVYLRAERVTPVSP